MVSKLLFKIFDSFVLIDYCLFECNDSLLIIMYALVINLLLCFKCFLTCVHGSDCFGYSVFLVFTLFVAFVSVLCVVVIYDSDSFFLSFYLGDGFLVMVV